jgi:RNA polymerase sigma-70 factor (ECF subfamily)
MLTAPAPLDRVASVDELTRLALAARDGERVALRTFIETSQAEVWRFVAHQVGPDEADDVTQDVYVRAWRGLPAFRQESGARTWLLAIARRAAVDALRRRGRRGRLQGRLLATPTPFETSDPSSAHATAALIDALDVRRREAFVLTQLLGCSYEEAAKICGVPTGTIRSRVARARGELIEQLRDAAAS